MTDFLTHISSWIIPAIVILAASFVACTALVLTQQWHGHMSYDSDLDGAQKIHESPVPRIGGVGLLVGLAAGSLVAFTNQGQVHFMAILLLSCALPVFGAGLIEDLTKKVSVKARLLASFASAAMAVALLDARLTDVDTPGLDLLIQYPIASIIFTCFAVGGMTNSVNIIDGLNGLAAGSVSLMLAGLATISWIHGDLLVMKLCLYGIAALVGFLFLNFPFGRIFLGDGGAYLTGFWVAECGVLLLARNPHVSTWAVLLACFYPVLETAYSAFRRHIVGRISSGQPDMNHLHHLIFKRVTAMRPAAAPRIWLQHGLSSGIIWMIVLSCQLTATLFENNTPALAISAIVMAMAYHLLYSRLTKKNQAATVRPDEAFNSAERA